MPNRLVYAPKAYVFTKASDGTLYNLSPFVTAGEVQRNINQVSSATVTLRNPNRVFTTPSNGVAFHPMDPITIYLERLSGYPVRVFTGYLDTTPYYQLHPGTVQLQASCTLKRLLYTYFDPSLPYVMAFFTKYGWINTGQGSIISPGALNGQQLSQNQNDGTAQDLSDGSFAKLLWAVLYDIAEWDDSNIWIEPIPSGENGVAARMEALMTSMQADQQAATKEFTSFLTAIIGSGGQGTGGGNSSSAGGGIVNSPLLNQNQNTFASAVSQGTGLDPNVVAAWVLNEESKSTSQAPNGANNWLNIGDTGSGNYGGSANVWNNPTTAGQFTVKWLKGASLPGYGVASSGIQAIPKTAGKSPQTQIAAIQTSGWASSGYPKLPQIYQEIVNAGGNKKSSSSSIGSSIGNAGSTATQAGSTAASNSGNAGSSSTSGYVNPYKGSGGISPSRVDMGVDAAGSGNILAIGNGKVGNAVNSGVGWPRYSGDDTDGGWISYTLSDGPLKGDKIYVAENITPKVQTGATVKAGDVIGTLDSGGVGLEMGWAAPGSSGDQGETLAASLGQNVPGKSTYGDPGAYATGAGNNFNEFLKALGWVGGTGGSHGNAPGNQKMPGGYFNTGMGIGSSGGSSNSSGNTTSNSSAEAFVAQVDFPSIEDQVTAIALGTEHKGLMHDQSVMPFVQQLCQASLRSFMSLPNGDFFAFYPDYFGEMGHRAPYWLIDDIEIMDGEIDLNDDALATHVFAVGDNSWPVNDELMNELFSAGTVSVFNAFLDSDITDASTVTTTDTNQSTKVMSKSGTGDSKATSASSNATAQSTALLNKLNAQTQASGGLADVMNTNQAVDFIKRYGARPLVQDYPMVRSPIYEMLMAYQLFMQAWSNQFKTPFTFTFMPELFPGGKVGFNSHGLMMYINSVTHSWDYAESGFTTTAQMSSPSLIPGIDASQYPDLPPNMVQAMAEPIINSPPTSSANKSTDTTAAAPISQVVSTVNQAASDAAKALSQF